MSLQTIAESVSSPDVIDGGAVPIKFLISKTHVIPFDSDSDTDSDPDS
jgi:hypothetical protein